MQIAISGNIGAGKTELTKLLSKHYGYKAVYGPSEENPYLNSFYEDMRRWSFNMMVHSMYAGVKELSELAKSGESFIRDRSLLDDVCVFAPNLQSMGLMTTRDLTTYTKMAETLMALFTTGNEPQNIETSTLPALADCVASVSNARRVPSPKRRRTDSTARSW